MTCRNFYLAVGCKRSAFTCVAFWLLAAGFANARVGETQDVIEKRLLADGTAAKIAVPIAAQGTGKKDGGFDIAIVYKLVNTASGLTGSQRPVDFSELYFYKTDDNTNAAVRLKGEHLPSGWEYRVYFYKGVSVLEVYHRIGASLSQGEVAALLALNIGEATWRPLVVDSASSISFIGYTFSRDDNAIMALKTGNDLVIFNGDLDSRLVGMKKKLDDPTNLAGVKILPAVTHGF